MIEGLFGKPSPLPIWGGPYDAWEPVADGLVVLGVCPIGYIVDGVFKFHDRYGIPWEMVFNQLKSAGMVPAFDLLFMECARQGMSDRGIKASILGDVGYVWGRGLREWVEGELLRGEASRTALCPKTP
jgi:hypothetical protein